MKRFLAIFLFLSVLLSFSGYYITVLAQTDKILLVPQEQVNPDTPSSYSVKRFKEKITLFFKFDLNSKADYYKILLDKRLAELAYIAENKIIAYIETASSRYESTAGQLTEILIKINSQEKSQQVKQKFNNHLPVLAQVQNNFSFSTAEWRFIENDINSLKIYSEQLSN